MNETETNELRAALDELLTTCINDDLSLYAKIGEWARIEKLNHESNRELFNAARVVARFLKWDDVPEGDIP